jgi:hypothetical protein
LKKIQCIFAPIQLQCISLKEFSPFWKKKQLESMASPFTSYSKNKIYLEIIEISPILKTYLFKIIDISQFREIYL